MAKSYLDNILQTAIDLGASDVHLMVNNVYFRVYGIMEKQQIEMPLDMVNRIVEVVAGDRELSSDMDLAYSQPKLGRFRVNIALQRGTYSLTLRHIKTKIPSLEELGLPEDLLDVTTQKKGLFIVTGPTNSGKSTTLSLMIDHINKTRSEKIVTLEDPIEFLHTNDKSLITQREIGMDTTFNAGLRSVLRQDPDVILLGEMRDKETMETALTASETGHLVLATMHTKDSVSSISRIIDVFPPDQKGQILSQLGDNLIGIFSQNLIPSTKGGLVLGYEKLILTRNIRNQIKNDNVKFIKQSMQTSKECKTLDKHLDELVGARLIDTSQRTDLLSK